jgi:hypothetical protein
MRTAMGCADLNAGDSWHQNLSLGVSSGGLAQPFEGDAELFARKMVATI